MQEISFKADGKCIGAELCRNQTFDFHPCVEPSCTSQCNSTQCSWNSGQSTFQLLQIPNVVCFCFGNNLALPIWKPRQFFKTCNHEFGSQSPTSGILFVRISQTILLFQFFEKWIVCWAISIGEKNQKSLWETFQSRTLMNSIISNKDKVRLTEMLDLTETEVSKPTAQWQWWENRLTECLTAASRRPTFDLMVRKSLPGCPKWSGTVLPKHGREKDRLGLDEPP